MTRVDFYVLPDAGGRLQLACRLTEKAYGLGHRVYVHAENQTLAEQIDELLWTFKQNSFVPHALATPADDDRSPVLIGCGATAPQPHEVLVNLAEQVPAFATDFERVVEVVDQETTVLTLSRARFRTYRERGLEPSSHRLD